MMIGSRFYIPEGWEASRSSHSILVRKWDWEGFGTLKPIHAGREEARGNKETKER